MKNRPLRIIIFALLMFGAPAAFLIYKMNGYYKKGENDSFHIRTGETFKVKVSENTYSKLVWLNEKKCRSVELLERTFDSGWNSYSGIASFTFIGKTNGTDTVKLAGCYSWEFDSLSFNEYEQPQCNDSTTLPDNVFIVKVD